MVVGVGQVCWTFKLSSKHVSCRIHVAWSRRREPGGGLVAIPDGFMVVHREAVISQAARNNVPAVYWQSIFAKDGGLLSYGPDYLDLFRRAALYVDRILNGTKPSELAVQLPVKFNMAININPAKGLGLVVPQSILLGADEVIE
jgi:putative ABC transport system substrate-binding protein